MDPANNTNNSLGTLMFSDANEVSEMQPLTVTALLTKYPAAMDGV